MRKIPQISGLVYSVFLWELQSQAMYNNLVTKSKHLITLMPLDIWSKIAVWGETKPQIMNFNTIHQYFIAFSLLVLGSYVRYHPRMLLWSGYFLVKINFSDSWTFNTYLILSYLPYSRHY